MTARPDTIGFGREIRKDAEKRIETPWLAYANYPYNIGHACTRYLVLCRLRGDERTRIDAGTRLLFDEGKKVVEPDVITRLEAMGYEVHRRQSRLKKEMKDKYNISGKVDVELLVPPRIQHDLGLPPCGPPPGEGGGKGANYLVPGEIKGMSSNNYRYLVTAEDMMDAMINAPASQWYMRQYPAQLLCYIWGLDKPYGVFILKNKLTGDVKDKVVYYDEHLDYFEGILQRCKRIEEYVAREELPDPIDEWQICERCDARTICLPENTEKERIALVSGMEPLLDKRDELLSQKRPLEQELKSLNAEINRRLEVVPDEAEETLMGAWRAKRKKGGGWTYTRLHGEAME